MAIEKGDYLSLTQLRELAEATADYRVSLGRELASFTAEAATRLTSATEYLDGISELEIEQPSVSVTKSMNKEQRDVAVKLERSKNAAAVLLKGVGTL